MCFQQSSLTYTENIQLMDLLPIQLDICKLHDAQLECTEHFSHMAIHFHKDWHIDVDCKLCYLDTQNHCHILQF